jgi:hypothetical protein
MLLAVLFSPPALRGAEQETKVGLPLRKVVAFTSGVSYFEHRGEVEGDARVDLRFAVEDVNDLLKSLVVQDLGGGKITTVTYGSKNPVGRRLASFALDLSGEPTLGQLLRQMRGARVKVEATQPLEGTIVGIELRREPGGAADSAPVEYLNLLTAEGLRSVQLATVGAIAPLDEALEAELRQALAVLAAARGGNEKTVSLRFAGEGKRAARVGYIRESPIWKTSYRLVFEDEGEALLQGWALVENTSEIDWRGVRLTLVSGRPISFTMNLYEPLYVRRPEVAWKLHGVVAPPLYEADLATRERLFREKAKKRSGGMGMGGMGGMGGGMGGGFFGGGGMGMSGGNPFGGAPAEEPINPGQGVVAAARGEEVGELFHYEIETPVTLDRQRSAMLPIVEETVEVEKLSIYAPSVHATHPLNGLRLTNDTSLHLMQGPITVFDDGAYAGDARLADMPPGGERLLSYALDLETEILRERSEQTRELDRVQIGEGNLYAFYDRRRRTRYVVKNSGEEAKQVRIEHAREDAWGLVEPEKPAETTPDAYRFSLTAEPGEPKTLTVVEEGRTSEAMALDKLPPKRAEFFLESDQVDEKIKAALRELAARQAALQEARDEKAALEARLKEIFKNQERLRANLAVLGQETELYRSYVQKLSRQETEVEKLEQQIRELEEQIDVKQLELAEFIVDLEIPEER